MCIGVLVCVGVCVCVCVCVGVECVCMQCTVYHSEHTLLHTSPEMFQSSDGSHRTAINNIPTIVQDMTVHSHLPYLMMQAVMKYYTVQYKHTM